MTEATDALKADEPTTDKSEEGKATFTNWLGVRSGERNFLIPIEQAGEILPMATIQPVPYVKPWFRGVCSVRSNLFGVVDLLNFFLICVTDHTQPFAWGNPHTQYSGITLNPSLGVNSVLFVETILGLISSSTMTLASDHDGVKDLPSWIGQVFQDAEGKCWQAIDLKKLAYDNDFLNIVL